MMWFLRAGLVKRQYCVFPLHGIMPLFAGLGGNAAFSVLWGSWLFTTFPTMGIVPLCHARDLGIRVILAGRFRGRVGADSQCFTGVFIGKMSLEGNPPVYMHGGYHDSQSEEECRGKFGQLGP